MLLRVLPLVALLREVSSLKGGAWRRRGVYRDRSDMPPLDAVAAAVGATAPWAAPKWVWAFCWRAHARLLPALHARDGLTNTCVNLQVLWLKALAGDDAAYALLPRGARLLVAPPLRRFYPRLHHQNIKLRAKFLDDAVRDELRLIVRESGYTGMYTGLTVSVLGIVAYRGPYFLLYDFLKQANPWKEDKGSKGLASKFVIAQATAIFAGLIALPLDVIRRGSIFAPELTILEVITRIFERAGPLGFFTGFGLNAVRTIVGALAIVMHHEARAMLK